MTNEKAVSEEAGARAPSLFIEYTMGGPSQESGTRKPEIQRLDAADQMRPDVPELWESDPADPDYLDLMQRTCLAWLRDKVGTHH